MEPQNIQKGYLIYTPITRKIFSLRDVVSEETFYSAFAYTSRPYSEAIATQPEVSYILHSTSSHEQTRDIINFAQFEEGD